MFSNLFFDNITIPFVIFKYTYRLWCKARKKSKEN